MSSGLQKWAFFDRHVGTAREKVLERLPGMGKIIYFDGWCGFGASAFLRSIAQVLPYRRTTPELCFDRVIFIDCSNWKNRRTVQRAIAEELELDHSVMSILDDHDENDDYNRVDESLRNEIDSVGKVIDQTLRDIKFMMIFLNGSDEDIDLGLLGVPRFARFGNNMMIWTFKRSLTMRQDDSEVVNKLRYTHGFISSWYKIKDLKRYQIRELLHQEATLTIARVPCMLDSDQKMVTNCCLYELFLKYHFHTTSKLDWASHSSTYWICDGIMQEDIARDTISSLHREIKWNCDASFLGNVIERFTRHPELLFLVIKDRDIYEEGAYRWISVKSSRRKIRGMRTIPTMTTSFFLAFERSVHPQTLSTGMFEHCSKLGVLVLYCCDFSFASPPFLKCCGLRFLGLDHCTDEKAIGGENDAEWLCLSSLWVLDLRYTNWNEIFCPEKMDLMNNIRELNIEGVMGWQFIARLQRRLRNLRRLRIIKPTCQWETPEDVDNYFIDKTSMEILDLSGNCDMRILPSSLSKASSLRLLVLDGCYELESVGGLPPSLESVSFNGYGPASQWTQAVELPPTQFHPSNTTDNKDVRITKISLAGCTKLEHMFLCWLPNLVELDLFGTAIKILDFNIMVVQVPRLKRLFLIGCRHLHAITFFGKGSYKPNFDLELMCVDTRVGIVCPRPSIYRNKPSGLHLHAIVVDARLTRSLMDLICSRRVHYNIHVTSSHTDDGFIQFEANNKDMIGPSDHQESLQLIPAGRYSDVLVMVGAAPMWAFPQPPTTKLDRHVEIAEGSFYAEREIEEGNALGRMVSECFVESLHVHDVSVRAPFPAAYSLDLRWCRMERCPKLETAIFLNSRRFCIFETFWASDLLMARCIWGGTGGGIFNDEFYKLRHLHLRSCPSLQVVLSGWHPSLPSLETLHIIHCGDLSHVFNRMWPDKDFQETFPKLTTIHLHDLPNLQNICDVVKMEAPALETIKIRGCWSLRRLPSVGVRGQGKKKPSVEIEKDVWYALEWDADHRPDHFETPVHSRYYKKKLPRVSVLR